MSFTPRSTTVTLAAACLLGMATAAPAQDEQKAQPRRSDASRPAPSRESGQSRDRAVPRESAPPSRKESSPPPRTESTASRRSDPAPRTESRRSDPAPRTESTAVRRSDSAPQIESTASGSATMRDGNNSNDSPRTDTATASIVENTAAEQSSSSSSGGQRAVPRGGSRPREGRVVQGGAINREFSPRQPTVYYPYYPRSVYPYGYGGYGLGYFYYDPYSWGPYFSFGYGYPYPSYAYPAYGYGPGYNYGQGYGPYYGAIRLKVKPREAEVFVDGYYVGRVDEFDGMFQRLELESGPHRIEIRQPGRPPLSFEVRIRPGETISYSADLKKLP